MSTLVLDTSAMLAHYRRETGYARVQGILEDDTVTISIVAVSIAEMARKLLNLGEDVDTARSVALAYANLANSIIPVDTALSVRAFELGYACGSRIPLVDAFIAAGASLIDASLVHRDIHFSEVPGGLLKQEFLE
jgi:predicted nucleic acid-binding protein